MYVQTGSVPCCVVHTRQSAEQPALHARHVEAKSVLRDHVRLNRMTALKNRMRMQNIDELKAPNDDSTTDEDQDEF